METKNLEKSIRDIFGNQNKYIIPLYQRNFSWRREQIEQLLQDVFSAFKQNPLGNYYIGSLVVLKRSNGDFEVIDGQQRLTVLSLITKILGINKEPRLFYDSRPEVEEFFKMFYQYGSCNIDYSQTAHLKNAIEFIKEIDLDAEKQTGRINDAQDIFEQGVSFRQYFENNVILVRVEIPQDTDVASYFEIMNNRGVQLQKHEILKSFLINKLPDKLRNEFAKIWTACSQMNVPIQKLFTFEDRQKYFGDSYDDFCFKGLTESDIETNDGNNNTLDYILKEDSTGVNTKDTPPEDSEINDDETTYKSIIDFPNFLMHIFKVMFSVVKDSTNEEKEITLNENNLINTYKAVSARLKPEEFIKTLFFCRTVFDRYIVKTVTDNKSEDGERWTLRKPRKKDSKWYYVDTFGKEEKTTDEQNREEKTTDEQNRIVKALSMLQVTFRTRIYKNWLFEILKWFYDHKTIDVENKNYLHLLDSIILHYYKERAIANTKIDENTHLTRENSYSEGLKTPHFIFNFIDYLYWVDGKNKSPLFEMSRRVKQFDFKYWNSIEHHMACGWASRNSEKVPGYDNYIDNLGNLCLISKSANSRLSDRDAKEKAETFNKGNLGAKRQIMYLLTNDSKWIYREEEIKKHYNELLDLLSKRKEILNYTD